MSDNVDKQNVLLDRVDSRVRRDVGLAGACVGAVFGFLRNPVEMPSFVTTLAGLLASPC